MYQQGKNRAGNPVIMIEPETFAQLIKESKKIIGYQLTKAKGVRKRQVMARLGKQFPAMSYLSTADFEVIPPGEIKRKWWEFWK